MKAIIKSGERDMEASVRLIGHQDESAKAAPLEDVFAPWKARVAGLEKALADRDLQLRGLREEIASARIEGEKEGHQRGRKEAEDREADRISLLREGMAQARTLLGESLANMEGLTAILTQLCLDKLFDVPGFRSQAIADILRSQIVRLEGEAQLHVTISAEDASDEGLTQLTSTLESSGVVVRSDPQMPSGSCILKPRLGEIDIGLDTQWRAIRALLEDMVNNGAKEACA